MSNKPYVDEFYKLYNNGDFESIINLLETQPQLKDMIITSEAIQYIYDMCISLERFYLSDIQNYLVNIIKPKGVFDSSSKYTKYDVVNYNTGVLNETFMGVKTLIPIGTLPTDPLYFIPITLSGATFVPDVSLDGNISWTNDKNLPNPPTINIKGDTGLGLTPKGLWNGSVAYECYDLVSYENKLWYCLKANTNQLPKPDSIYWTIALQINDGNADTVDNYHVDNTKNGTNTTTDDALWTANKINNLKANKSDINSFFGTATYLDGVVSISFSNINNISMYTVTFEAPSDFSSLDTYKINETEVVLADLNNKPLLRAWSEGAAITLSVFNNKAFFKGGGGLGVYA